ncbi:MAG: hypothetical protein ACI9JY_002095 [Saprospiraceae bacterium]|jgi:hypothetical protein
MVLVLKWTCFSEVTQRILECNGTLDCYTIELPWLGNQRSISCIPEGEYILQKRFSLKFKWHLHLKNVLGRDLILIHPANDNKKELLGCIALVTKLTGIAKGSNSQKALEKLKTTVYAAFDRNEEVKMSILDSRLRGKDK